MKIQPFFPIAAPVALSALVLASCGDVNVNPAGPWSGYGDNWWSDRTEYVASRTQSLQEPIDGRTRISVESKNGSVAVAGEPGSDSIGLTAKLMVGSDTEQDAQEGLDRLGITVQRLPGEIVVRTDQPAEADGRQYVVEYTLAVPANLAVSVTQGNGPVTVADIGGLVNVEVGNGAVALNNIRGGAVARVGNGSIEGAAALPAGGRIQLTTGNGRINLRLPRSTSAALSAQVGTGAISWNNLPLAVVHSTPRSLTAVLGDGRGTIELRAGNGNIAITGVE